MKDIAHRYIEELEKTPAQLADENRQILLTMKKFSKSFLYGVMSVFLYSLLYKYSADLIQLAQDAHAGHRAYFFLPIIIALVFSVVHGSFTAELWDSLGVKAKKRK